MTIAAPPKHDATERVQARGDRRARRVLLVVMLLLIASVTVWTASWRRPSGPASGNTFGGHAAAAPPTDRTLRVATFNIRGGKGLDDQRDLARTAESLENLDLIALNEVHGPWFWQRHDQAKDLGRRLGHAWLFAPTEQRWWHRDFGNGLLTSLPASHWQRIPLARRFGDSHRNVTWAVVIFDDRKINVLVTHVDRSDDRDRRAQLEAVAELFLSLESPAILMGDMNSTAEDQIIRRLLDAEDVEDCLGQVLNDHHTGRIDWIFARGFEVADADMINSGASDHPCFWAELRFSEP